MSLSVSHSHRELWDLPTLTLTLSVCSAVIRDPLQRSFSLSLKHPINTWFTRVRLVHVLEPYSARPPPPVLLSLITSVRWHSPELSAMHWMDLLDSHSVFKSPINISWSSCNWLGGKRPLRPGLWWFSATHSTIPQDRDKRVWFFFFFACSTRTCSTVGCLWSSLFDSI